MLKPKLPLMSLAAALCCSCASNPRPNAAAPATAISAATEPFPNRIIYHASFDTHTEVLANPDRSRGKYPHWPGDLDIVSADLPPGSWWGVARAVPREQGRRQWLRLMIDPPKPVGRRTKLRFRYHLSGVSGGASAMTVQIFDATDQDNRHVTLRELPQNEWTFATVDLARDAKRNDGGRTEFAAGHLVDDIFFFVDHPARAKVTLLVDEVTLYDAGEDR